MNSPEETFFFIEPELRQVLTRRGVGLTKLLRQSGIDAEVKFRDDPAPESDGEKEPATIILASAALLAAATPLLRDFLRNVTGRDVELRERHLLPVEDSNGRPILDSKGKPKLYWVDAIKGSSPAPAPYQIKIKGWGVEISFGGQ